MTDQEGGVGSLAELGARPAGLAWLLGGGGGQPTACPFAPISLPERGEEAAGTRPRASGLAVRALVHGISRSQGNGQCDANYCFSWR